MWDKPANLNNVETWANVPLIIERGAEWFRGIGTEKSKGTKVFSLTGMVKNTGLVEVPMGITLREVVFGIGGGLRKGKRFKAVQTGGPSGGFLPERLLDLKVDFDELWQAGSMMGSGGMIVMDEDSCMVDAARFYVNFLAHESCGQCVPCREGLRQMLRILDRIVGGQGQEGDLELLEELCELLADASLCALGASAPFPVRSALTHFREVRQEVDSRLGSSAPEPSPGVKFTPGPPDVWSKLCSRPWLGAIESAAQAWIALLIAGSRVGLPPWQGFGDSVPDRRLSWTAS